MDGNPETQVAALLKKYKATLVRTKRHFVWKFPHGPVFTQACTPSDSHVAANQLHDLKRLLGLNEPRGVPGTRRHRIKKAIHARAISVTPSASSAMLEAMRKTGLMEKRLNEKIATATIELRAARQANHRKKVNLCEIQEHCKRCWGCRLWRWWKQLRLRGTI